MKDALRFAAPWIVGTVVFDLFVYWIVGAHLNPWLWLIFPLALGLTVGDAVSDGYRKKQEED